MKRITALDREERKKQEKREKKESDDELRLYPFIKYSKIPKHQVGFYMLLNIIIAQKLGWIYIYIASFII